MMFRGLEFLSVECPFLPSVCPRVCPSDFVNVFTICGTDRVENFELIPKAPSPSPSCVIHSSSSVETLSGPGPLLRDGLAVPTTGLFQMVTVPQVSLLLHSVSGHFLTGLVSTVLNSPKNNLRLIVACRSE